MTEHSEEIHLSGRQALLATFVIILAVALVALALILRREVPRETPQKVPPTIETMTVIPATVQFELESQGTVQALHRTQLTSEVPGRVTGIDDSLRNGGFFKEGTVLVELDDRDFRAALARAEAEVARARLALLQEEADAEQARIEWKELGHGEAPPLVLREPQVAGARATLASAIAQEDKAKLDLERTRIRAPYDGRVMERKVGPGAIVSGSPADVLAEIYSTERAEVALPLQLDDFRFLSIPDARNSLSEDEAPRVVLKSRIQGGAEWEGWLERVGAAIDERSRMLMVVAVVPDPFGESARGNVLPLKPGTFVTAVIQGKTLDNVIVIPRSAMVDRDTLLVVSDEDTLHRRTVEILRATRDSVYIGGGLEAGERICISPVAYFVEGMPVLVLPDRGTETANREKTL